MSLSPSHLQTLCLFCDSLLPSVAVENDRHGYWRRTASDLNIAQLVADDSAAPPAEKDRNDLAQLGQSIVDYRLSPYDRAHSVRGVQEAARVHVAAGACEVRTLHNQPVVWRRGDDLGDFIAQIGCARYEPNTLLLGSAHQMGTCRMGRDAQTSVADPFGQAHGVKGLWIGDASAFPTASGVNPLIAIMALAQRTAGHIKSKL